MRWISGARRMLTLQWAGPAALGSCRWRRAGVRAGVVVVALIAVVVGVALKVVDPSRAGAAGLRSNASHPSRDSKMWVPDPCDIYGSHAPVDHLLDDFAGQVNRWPDRVPIWRGDGTEIVFADGNAVYAASVHGTKLWRPAREDTASFYVDGRWRYVREGIVSFDVSRVDGALVYATCWSYKPIGSEAKAKKARIGGRLAYPAGSLHFDIGDDLYEITVVRPDEGTANRLHLGNFPTWSPDGRRIAFVSSYWWRTRVGLGRLREQPRVQIMAADGTGLQSIFLPAGKHAEFPPRWSPDGTRLAFVVIETVQDGATYAIYTVGADGTGLTRLAEARSNPAWSPDGTRLAFVQAHRDGDLHVYTMAADGTDVRQITATPVGALGSEFRWVRVIAWSPDGARLLYGCANGVCVVDLEGQAVGGMRALVAPWSADGRRIALYSPAHGDRGGVVLASGAPDGSDWRALVRAGADGRLVADQAENILFPGPVATRAACSEGVVVPAPAQHPGLVADCETLVTLRAELFGWAGTNWTTNTPLGEWEGVVVGGAPPRVRELVLGDGAIGTFDHGGRLPAAMAELAFLERLDLSGNGLTGSIPAAWGALAQLRWLDLRENKLTSAIPGELGQLGNLERLNLNHNHLSGTIPAALGQSGNLRWLYLADNDLSGTIPAALGQLRNLEQLWLTDNQLSGAIPAGLGQLQNFSRLRLAGNQLTGCIPAGLRRVRVNDLAQLNLPDCGAGT